MKSALSQDISSHDIKQYHTFQSIIKETGKQELKVSGECSAVMSGAS